MKLWIYSKRKIFSVIGKRTRFWGGGDSTNTQSTTTNAAPQFIPQPQTPQQQQALGTWGQTLQDWSTQPGYGAIQPDWGTIWNDANTKINQSYYGSPTNPGAWGAVQGDAASRGMSDSPALQANETALGASYGNTMQTEAANESVQKTNIEQQGQANWLNSIMGLAQTTEPGQWYSPSSSTNTTGTQNESFATAMGGLLGSVAKIPAPYTATSTPGGGTTMSGGGSLVGNWLTNALNFNKPGGAAGVAQSGITADNGAYADVGSNWMTAFGGG